MCFVVAFVMQKYVLDACDKSHPSNSCFAQSVGVFKISVDMRTVSSECAMRVHVEHARIIPCASLVRVF